MEVVDVAVGSPLPGMKVKSLTNLYGARVSKFSRNSKTKMDTSCFLHSKSKHESKMAIELKNM